MEQTMNSTCNRKEKNKEKDGLSLGIVVVLVLWVFSGYNGMVERAGAGYYRVG